MNNKKKIHIAILLAVIVIGIILVMKLVAESAKEQGKALVFAQCLADSGAKFYGAFWCPHCQQQERMLGLSRNKLEKKAGLYIECSTPDARGQKQICKDAGIDGYPTWEFADGTRMSGEIELGVLAEKTNCSLPEATQ